MVKTLEEIENGTAKRTKQVDDFTVAPMLSKDMAKIDWKNKTAKEIKNLVRGLNPIMGAFSMLNGKKIKFWSVEALDEDDMSLNEIFKDSYIENKKPGEILLADCKKGLFVKAKQGVIVAKEVQGENARRMNVGDFLRGFKVNVGECLE